MRYMKWTVAMAIGAVPLMTGCGSGDDPYRDAVSDERAPEMIVTVRDDDGEPVADIAYETPKGRIPDRAAHAFLQAQDGDNWSTAYTLGYRGDGYVEGVPSAFDDIGRGGPGPDTYRLPGLDADDSYRICIEFVVGHPATSAVGCSAPFAGS